MWEISQSGLIRFPVWNSQPQKKQRGDHWLTLSYNPFWSQTHRGSPEIRQHFQTLPLFIFDSFPNVFSRTITPNSLFQTAGRQMTLFTTGKPLIQCRLFRISTYHALSWSSLKLHIATPSLIQVGGVYYVYTSHAIRCTFSCV